MQLDPIGYAESQQSCECFQDDISACQSALCHIISLDLDFYVTFEGIFLYFEIGQS